MSFPMVIILIVSFMNIQCSRNLKKKSNQNKTKQNKTKQTKKQNKAKQNKTKQNEIKKKKKTHNSSYWKK